jgi:acetolactate synthase I/II/III large subunit
MRGAEALLRTLLAGGVDVCFTNPGTSEMQFVSALDRVPGMRAVLALFEGVATGAADGYARMADKPAATLLHLGPGLANGLANLHNARRAEAPIINIIGEHATWHLKHDAPLASDIAGFARPVSGWIRTSRTARTIAADTADAIVACQQPPGQIATLITPADCTLEDCDGPAPVGQASRPATVDDSAILEAATALRSGEPALILLGGGALRERPLEYAGRIAGQCGARIASATFYGRQQRGAGRVSAERLPYNIDQALRFMNGVGHLILVGARPPVSFFAYPNKPGWLTPAGAQIHTLAGSAYDIEDALARLADAMGATRPAEAQALSRPSLPTGPLNPDNAAQVVAALMPEDCIVVDEAVTSGWTLAAATAGCPPHDWLPGAGGAIGGGMPKAVGAAIACPDRRVLNLQADGSAAYTLQSLWTQAREQLKVTTVLYANRAYRILENEFLAAEAGERPGPQAGPLLDLGRPDMDWVKLAQGFGVPAKRVERAEEFAAVLKAYLAEPGPNLIEVVL